MKLLEENRGTNAVENKKITKAGDLKIGQLVFVKNHHKGTFDPHYSYEQRI